MHRDPIRRSLAWGLTATVLLPIILAVVLGLGALLGGLGDADAAAVCGRIGLLVGVLWLSAVVVTTAANAVATLDRRRPRRRCREREPHRGRRGRRRRGPEPRTVPGLGESPSDRPA